jgi:hypothetical protein
MKQKPRRDMTTNNISTPLIRRSHKGVQSVWDEGYLWAGVASNGAPDVFIVSGKGGKPAHQLKPFYNMDELRTFLSGFGVFLDEHLLPDERQMFEDYFARKCDKYEKRGNR